MFVVGDVQSNRTGMGLRERRFTIVLGGSLRVSRSILGTMIEELAARIFGDSTGLYTLG